VKKRQLEGERKRAKGKGIIELEKRVKRRTTGKDRRELKPEGK